MDLTHATAVVTGAGAGIGRAVAAELLAAGAHVVAVDRDKRQLDSLRRSLPPAIGDRLIPHVADVRVPSDAEPVIAHAETAPAPFRLLVNNAGVERPAHLVDLTDDAMRLMVDTNLLGAFWYSRATARRFITAGTGTIVNMCSVTSLRGYAGTAGYSATKFGLNGLTESLQEELREYGIRVIGVYPGSVATALLRDAVDEAYFAKALAPEDIAGLVTHVVGLPDHVVVEKIVVRPLIERPYSDPVV
jgi:NADP-dependent 3-hydroxy acid dehydrogenase YdfG